MELNKEEKIKRYHYEETLLILFICASDLSQYGDDDLINFAEDIEGRIEVLFEPNYLKGLDKFLKVDISVLQDFNKLRNALISMYESKWHRKLKEQVAECKAANMIAKNILEAINVDWVEPITYKEHHLNVDWT